MSKTPLTFTELVEEVETSVAGVYSRSDWQDVIRGIENMFLEFRGLGVSGKVFMQYSADELSRMAGELAVLRSSLISIKEKADRERKIANRLCEVRKPTLLSVVRDELHAKADAMKKKAPTVGEIDAETSRRMAKVHLVKDLHEAQFEKLQGYWYSIPDIVRSCEIRIHELNADRSTADKHGWAGEDSLLSDISAHQGDNYLQIPHSEAGDSKTPDAPSE